MKRYFFISMVLLVVLASFSLIYWGVFHKKPVTYIPKEVKINGVFLAESRTVEDFQLTDHKGKPFSKDNLMGRWTMMFFGFTNCGYVCPTTMSALNQMYKQLKTQLPSNQLPQIVLVTVDPERDSMAKMNDFINAYNKDFIGARAELNETEAFEKQLHITAVKIQEDDQPKDQYMINHSAEILVFNPQGQLQAYLSFPPKVDRLIHDYKTMLATEIS